MTLDQITSYDNISETDNNEYGRIYFSGEDFWCLIFRLNKFLYDNRYYLLPTIECLSYYDGHLVSASTENTLDNSETNM